MLPTVFNRRNNWLTDPTDLIRRELGQFFGPGDMSGAQTNSDLIGAYPMDICETENEIIVEAEVPGFEKNQIQISMERGMLAINAERKSEENQGEKHLSERRYLRVHRRFAVPAAVDESKVDASLKNGVLTLKLQKKAEAKPKLIAIK